MGLQPENARLLNPEEQELRGLRRQIVGAGTSIGAVDE